MGINTEEAQRTVQQVQQQARQETQYIVGSVMNLAEQAHRNKTIAQKSGTEEADAKLNEKLTAKPTSNHNTTHRNEHTPANRAQPKAKEKY